ncbi:MAG TPA: heavy-metal-associated domain-containing protein [Albitalea sp.]
MIDFEVHDMSCGRCASAITRALGRADPNARVQVDLAAHRVRVESAVADAEALAGAIREAGYTPVRAGGTAAG